MGCIQADLQKNIELDQAAIELQRSAFWHREYYFHLLKWNGKNRDSVEYYERKTDSVLGEYHRQIALYDSLSKVYNQKN